MANLTQAATILEHPAINGLAERLRADFPLLAREVRGKPLAYLDNAASAQKPRQVIDAVANCYRHEYANVHRGVHYLSEVATANYEGVRERVRDFLHAAATREIIFVRGATEAINLVAHGLAESKLRPGDEILITQMEHHANIVPWQMACRRSGARLRYVPIDERGELALEELDSLLGPRTRRLALTHVSNALGTVNDVATLIRRAHEVGALVLVDGAQAVAHLPVDVAALDCDFYTFSGHKLFGPTGTGVLYGKEALLEALPPYQGGGDMIKKVTMEETTYNDLPWKFEAGTPHIAGVIGLGAAIDYVRGLDMAAVAAHEADLLERAEAALRELKGVRILGEARHKCALVSFVVAGVHAHDVSALLDDDGIAVRAGHHCSMPVMDRYGVAATTRASFTFYNGPQEVDRMATAVARAQRMFARR